MLIDKGMKADDIVTIKLTSGEELVAKLVEETDTFIKMSRPLVLTASQKGVAMVPYLFTVDPDSTIKINRSTVTVFEITDEDAAKQYIHGTTGISLI